MQMGVSYKVVYPEKFLKAQAKREKEIVGKMDEVLRIREKQAALRAQQRIKRDKKKTTLKLNGWRNGYKIQKEPEAELRPPDRQYDIRVYSLQDKCLWTMPELGEWYNAYAKPERPETSDPLKGGYMVPRVKTPPAPWHSHPKHHPQPVVDLRGGQVAQRSRIGGNCIGHLPAARQRPGRASTPGEDQPGPVRAHLRRGSAQVALVERRVRRQALAEIQRDCGFTIRETVGAAEEQILEVVAGESRERILPGNDHHDLGPARHSADRRAQREPGGKENASRAFHQ